MELKAETKKQIAEGLLHEYQKQLYQMKLESKCAEAIEDEKWTEGIRKQTQRLMKILTVLEEEIADA